MVITERADDMKGRAFLAVGAAVLVLAGSAQAQTVRFVNDAGIRPSYVLKVQQALYDQMRQLRRYWHGPPIVFGHGALRAGGWTIYLVSYRAMHVECDDAATALAPEQSITGCHDAYGNAWVGAARGLPWSLTASHELCEIAAGHEVGDYDYTSYTLDGIDVQDFLLPAWYDKRAGALDFIGDYPRR